ncbi:MAG: SusC/RagA family TonB-linked outer membrane protein [Porphyromonadaceae bacterium]|nr:SusC/RagA family TonB-linked outer membrane protein [Porphyromonadaceae bacterium]
MRVLKQFLLMALLGLFVIDSLGAQATRKVVGVVKDDKGEPLIGVQVIPVGATQNGGLTDFDGNYSVDVPKGIKQLSFSYIGFATQTIDINGRSKIDVTMREDSQQLEAVVVTALGIKRKSKTLTYATQSVDNKELTRIKEPNFVNALRGKSAGLTITPNNSGAGGGSTKITLRGQNSILGTNQPLIVLDGVPLSSGPSGQTTDLLQGGGRDGGDILSTINPDDIASLTVLKGPNAAALYGSSANNGVLIITTKSGREGKLRVDVSTSTMVDLIADYPELQKTYGLGAGYDGWGKRISELTDDELAATPYLTRTPRNTIKDFFNLGFTQNTAATISGGTEKQQTYFSYANTYQTGIMPKNKFMRHNIMFKQSYKLFERLDLDLSMNYIHQNTLNRPIIGRSMSPMAALYRTPASVDMRYFRHNYQHPGTYNDLVVYNPIDGRHNSKLLGQPVQTWFWLDTDFNNPWWLMNMLTDDSTQDRLLGTLSAKVKILDNLNFQTRTNLDYIQNRGFNSRYATSIVAGQALGASYYTGRSYSTDFFQDALLSYNQELGKALSLQATAGASHKRSANRSLSVGNDQDTAARPNIFLPQNDLVINDTNKSGRSANPNERWGDNWEAALFATATLGWDDKIFVDGSYRVEWAKSFQQFAKENEYISFSFYSAGANAQLDKLLPLGKQFNSLKLRTSFSVVGNPVPNQDFFAQGINLRDPSGSISPAPPPFKDPKPETTTSFEVGLDGALFDNLWDFDLTFYNSTLKNQFLYIDGVPVNTGKIRNWGVEFSTNYRVNITKDLTWRPGFNIAYNDNKILETYIRPDGTPHTYVTGPNKFKVKYVKGGAYGDIYVNSFLRDDKGHIVLQDDGNTPVLASGGFDTKVGNATARINFGLNNTFSYKNFQLYMLIDGKIGGKVMSLTQPDMDLYGVSVRSAEARDRGYVELNDGSGRRVNPEIYYKTIGGNPIEDYIYDATNLRLRDVSLSYTFYDLLGSSKNLQLSAIARNLFFIYRNSPIDPDISQSAANGFGGIDAYSMPTTRTFGISAKVTF